MANVYVRHRNVSVRSPQVPSSTSSVARSGIRISAGRVEWAGAVGDVAVFRRGDACVAPPRDGRSRVAPHAGRTIMRRPHAGKSDGLDGTGIAGQLPIRG